MLDDFGNTIPGTEDAPVAVQPEPVQEVVPVVEAPVVEAAPAADIVDKLEKILSAVGYELPPLWGEAVALARKTI